MENKLSSKKAQDYLNSNGFLVTQKRVGSIYMYQTTDIRDVANPKNLLLLTHSDLRALAQEVKNGN